MPLDWNPGLYKIGVEPVDTQHTMLFEALKRLRESYGKPEEEKVVSDMIVFLGDYAVKHFADEEALMVSLKMPAIERHKEQHGVFIENHSAMKAEYEKDGATRKLLMTIYSNIFKWLVEHISISDREISLYINK